MVNQYELEAEGTEQSKDDDLLKYVHERWNYKDDIHEKRFTRRKAISDSTESLLQTMTNAKANPNSANLFFSNLLHYATTFLWGAKLTPDSFLFTPDQPGYLNQKPQQQANDLTYTHRLMRRKGSFDKAIADSKKDLILGESVIMRTYEIDTKGNVLRPKYEYVPWEDYRGRYGGVNGDTDEIYVKSMDKRRFVAEYGEDMLEKVSEGGFLSKERSDIERIDYDFEDAQDMENAGQIDVVSYVDHKMKIYVVYLGGNAYEHIRLEGDDFPFQKEDGEGYSPFLVRRFFQPIQGDFGYGVLDMLLPLAAAETTLLNAAIRRSLRDTMSPVFMRSENPGEMANEYAQWEADIEQGVDRPRFVRDSRMGTSTQTDELKVPTNNNNTDYWEGLFLKKASMSTGIDFTALTEFAPTADQQRLRLQVENKLNTRILATNKVADEEFAMNDLHMLQEGNSEFHDFELLLPDYEVIEGDEDIFNGNLPSREVTVRELMAEQGDLDYTVTSQMEGVFDSMTVGEVDAISRDILSGMFQPGTEAHKKASLYYFSIVHPKMNIGAHDLVPPQPEAEPQSATGEFDEEAGAGVPSLESGNLTPEILPSFDLPS